MPRIQTVAALLTVVLLVAGTGLAERFGGTLVEGSRIVYDASAGWETWQGSATPRLERFSFDDADVTRLTLDVRVDAEDFSSGNFLRDVNARRTVFEISDHREIAFVAERVARDDAAGDASRLDLPDGAERSWRLVGTLRLHGVERSIDVPVTVLRDGDRLAVTGGFSVLLSDYDMSRPSILGRSVDDSVTIRFDLVVALAPS